MVRPTAPASWPKSRFQAAYDNTTSWFALGRSSSGWNTRPSSAYGAGILAEEPLPGGVRQHHLLVCVGPILFRLEYTPEFGLRRRHPGRRAASRRRTTTPPPGWRWADPLPAGIHARVRPTAPASWPKSRFQAAYDNTTSWLALGRSSSGWNTRPSLAFAPKTSNQRQVTLAPRSRSGTVEPV